MPPKGKDPVFTRQVPKFLSTYTHLLTTNKKNYLGEEIQPAEDDDFRSQVETKTLQDYKETFLASGCESYNPDNEDKDMLPQRPFTYVISSNVETQDDVIVDKDNEKGSDKILFKKSDIKKIKRDNFLSKTTSGGDIEDDKKINKKSKKNILSFDFDD